MFFSQLLHSPLRPAAISGLRIPPSQVNKVIVIAKILLAASSRIPDLYDFTGEFIAGAVTAWPAPKNE